MLSRYRPPCLIVAVTKSHHTVRALHLHRSVYPVLHDGESNVVTGSDGTGGCYSGALSPCVWVCVPMGSPSRDGDVEVYVFNTNQLSLPTPFYSVLVSVSVFQLYFIP